MLGSIKKKPKVLKYKVQGNEREKMTKQEVLKTISDIYNAMGAIPTFEENPTTLKLGVFQAIRALGQWAESLPDCQHERRSTEFEREEK